MMDAASFGMLMTYVSLIASVLAPGMSLAIHYCAWGPMDPPGWMAVGIIRRFSSLNIRQVMVPVPSFIPGMAISSIALKC